MKYLRPIRRGPLDERRRRDDRGSQFIEFAAYFPLLLIVAVMVMELFLGFLAMERMGNAARNGARVAAEYGTERGQSAARDSLPGWLDKAEVTTGRAGNGYYVDVEVRMPIMFPATGLDIPVSRRVNMPNL
ncbi:hypothetical protein GCM10009799_32710 [Nocardiopsis rhodophaea]|uniref:TadE-like domain-containing protein n=1 Tax=Nocardiopsis rhodophaea TaxID=280238 RepID=A0ABP5ER74_9ACTN